MMWFFQTEIEFGGGIAEPSPADYSLRYRESESSGIAQRAAKQ